MRLFSVYTEGVESVGVCLLHAFANPQHEVEIGDFIKKNTHIYTCRCRAK